MKFPIYKGRMAVSFGTPLSKDRYSNGIRLECDQSATFVTYDATGSRGSDGFRLSPTGALVVVDCATELPPDTVFSNGLPVSHGAVCISTAPPVEWSNGIPFTEFGAISIGPDDDPGPPVIDDYCPDINPLLSVLAKYGQDAHMWLPGAGYVCGMNVKNWLNVAGTVEAQEAQPVGRIDDLAGSIFLGQPVDRNQPIVQGGAGNAWYWGFEDVGPSFLPMSGIPFTMADDAVIVAGVSVSASSNGGAIFASSNASNHRLPLFYVSRFGGLGIYTLSYAGQALDVVDSYDNRGKGPFVATLRKVGTSGKLRRDGIYAAEATFATSYPEAAKSALGACNGGAVTSPLNGSLYPVIIINGQVSDDDLLTIEQFVAAKSGVDI